MHEVRQRSALMRTGVFVAAVSAVSIAVIIYGTNGAGVRLSNNQLIGQIAAVLIAALGLNLLVGRVGMHSFAQGAFMGIGAYSFAYAHTEWSAPFLVSLCVAAVLPSVCGAVIAVATTRMRGPQLAMVTLILAVVVHKFLSEAKFLGQFGGYPNVSAHGSSLIRAPEVFGHKLEPPLFAGAPATAIVPVVVLAALALILCRRLVNTPWGLSLSAIKQSELLAAHLGVNVYLRKVAVVALAAGMAGVGGACYALVFAHLQPETFTLMLGVNLMIMVIFGGAGSIIGPLIGTAPIVYLQTAPSIAAFVRWQNETISGRWYLSPQGLIALVMLLVLFVMPKGIAGTARAAWGRWRQPRPDGLRSEESELLERAQLPVGESPGSDDTVPTLGRIAEPTAARDGGVLVVDDVALSFGGVRAVDGVSFRAAAGQIVALIGPNGAGKSSVVNLISGVYSSRQGQIRLDEHRLDRMPAHSRSRLGVKRTFQTPLLAPELTVAQNVAAGVESAARSSLLGSVVPVPGAGRRRHADAAQVHSVLELVGLEALADSGADELSYGQQRLLELARALVGAPGILVLDEPAAGLNPTEIGVLGDLLESLRDRGLGIVLVEHHMDLVRRLADDVLCMIDGRVAVQGLPDTVLSDPAVIAAYLGTGPSAPEGQEVPAHA